MIKIIIILIIIYNNINICYNSIDIEKNCIVVSVSVLPNKEWETKGESVWNFYDLPLYIVNYIFYALYRQ